MELRFLRPRGFAANCYLLVSANEAALVDPGSNAKRILEELAESKATLRYILLTHAHFDHMGALREILRVFPVPVCLHEKDADFPADPFKNASFLVDEELRFPLPDRLLSDGETLPLGTETIRVLHTPGHTAGSCCFLAGSFLLTGDTLFSMGVGRTDLYSGDADTLKQSLARLEALPKELRIYPGHGGSCSLEKALRDANDLF